MTKRRTTKVYDIGQIHFMTPWSKVSDDRAFVFIRKIKRSSHQNYDQQCKKRKSTRESNCAQTKQKVRLPTAAAAPTHLTVCISTTDNNLPTNFHLLLPPQRCTSSCSPCRCPWRDRPCTSSRTGRSWRRRWRWSLSGGTRPWSGQPLVTVSPGGGSHGWWCLSRLPAPPLSPTPATPSQHTIDGGRAEGGC